MGLADEFQEVIDALPSDWTDLSVDVRVDEERYIEAATYLVICNHQPYSHHDWHFRIPVAHTFGHAAAAPVVHAALKMLDNAGIAGEIRVTDVRMGRTDVTNAWGRPESVRQEMRRIRAQ